LREWQPKPEKLPDKARERWQKDMAYMIFFGKRTQNMLMHPNNQILWKNYGNFKLPE
jgi:hypothetical protein